MINAFDTIFGSLMVWQDTNSDGVTDIGELSFLSSHGIDGFELQETHEGVTTPGGKIIASSATLSSTGSVGRLYPVNLFVYPTFTTSTEERRVGKGGGRKCTPRRS